MDSIQVKLEDKKIFFQSSLPRAGSTLMQNILAQNPRFYTTPTSGVLELLYSARDSFSSSTEFKAQNSVAMSKGFKSFCKEGLQGFFKGITEKPCVVDKSRGWGIHYDFLDSFLEEKPKIICMVRDIRDIYTSMEKNFRANPEMSQGLVNWETGRCTTVSKRIDHWKNTVPVGLALERLREMIDRGIADNILFVRYEDLCSNPQAVMKDVYSFLGEEVFEHDFKNVEQTTVEDDSVYGAFGQHTIRKEVKPLVSASNKVLGKGLSDRIFRDYQWYNQYFNYNL